MKNINAKKVKLTWAFCLINLVIFAQDAGSAPVAKAGTQEFSNVILWVYLGVIGALVLVTAGIALRTLKIYQDLLITAIAKEQGREAINLEKEVVAKESWFSKVWFQLFGTGGQTYEQNNDIQINHPHDGIYELDNGMPPWLRNIFVGTIAFGICYFWYYHSYLEGKQGQHYEYKMAMREGEIIKAEVASRQANAVSESTVVALTDANDLSAGKGTFIEKCAACHGQKGEGGVGPNMTDDYWLHGGDIKSVFSVVKYGVLEKGMISWKEQLSPKEMQEVSSYILTMKGTNPPNPKAPQGELFKAEMSDTTKKLTPTK
jgi:cytochrome c oxidase cbb3-type subunit III